MNSHPEFGESVHNSLHSQIVSTSGNESIRLSPCASQAVLLLWQSIGESWKWTADIATGKNKTKKTIQSILGFKTKTIWNFKLKLNRDKKSKVLKSTQMHHIFFSVQTNIYYGPNQILNITRISVSQCHHILVGIREEWRHLNFPLVLKVWTKTSIFVTQK